MTDCICIDVAALGTQRHLIVDDGFAWGDSVPDDSWHLTGTIKLHSDRCCDTLFRLNGVIVDLKPPQRFVNAMSHVLSNDLPVPWAKVMPARDHRAFVKRVTAIVVDSMATISKKY